MKILINISLFLLIIVLNDNAGGFRFKRQDLEDEPAEVNVPAAPCETDSGSAGFCMVLTACSALLADVNAIANNTCELDSQTSGVCCSNTSTVSLFSAPITRVFAFSSPVAPIPVPPIGSKELSDTNTDAIQKVQEEENLEQNLVAEGLTIGGNTAEDLHNLITFAQPESQELSKQAAVTLEASLSIATRLSHGEFGGASGAPAVPPGLPGAPPVGFSLDASSAPRALSSINVANSPIASSCDQHTFDCPASKYRTIDGSCNNLVNKGRGKANTAFTRMASAEYADGISAPRVASDKGPLPSCRLISTSIVQAKSTQQPTVNALFQAFGQFVDHDLSQTPTNKIKDKDTGAVRGIACCPPETPPEKRHPECMEISIPKNDPFFKAFKKECMEFVRSIEAASTQCRLGQREQQNQLTSYLDASQIYGNLDRVANDLRENAGGRLKVSTGKGKREFPPTKPDQICKGDINDNTFCVVAGDVRAAEQPMLTTFHILFMREHNRIAGRLNRLHPEWSDETIYQETRRIVIATYQHIIYNEFLPLLLGQAWIREFDLGLPRSGYVNKYDTWEDASILNEFATAAFRYGHSLVQSDILLSSKRGFMTSQKLVDHFLTPFNGSLLEDYIRGGMIQVQQKMDNNVVAELTNHLFQRNSPFGLDLAAINCQRGRDHAIGSYNSLRRACGLETAFSFRDLERFMEPNVARSFAKVYKNVDDIDLWVGGIAEKPFPGAVVGPVFACIIGEQFKRLRFGDRFWYENGDGATSFSEAQLRQIRKASLARIICDNTDIDEIQSLAFIFSSRWNPKFPCRFTQVIPKVNLGAWRNEPTPS